MSTHVRITAHVSGGPASSPMQFNPAKVGHSFLIGTPEVPGQDGKLESPNGIRFVDPSTRCSSYIHQILRSSLFVLVSLESEHGDPSLLGLYPLPAARQFDLSAIAKSG